MIDTSSVNGPLTIRYHPPLLIRSPHIAGAGCNNGGCLIAMGALRFIDLSMAARENGEFTTPQVLSSAVRVITA